MVKTTDEDAPPAPFNSMEFDAGSEEMRTATAAVGAVLLETTDDDDAAPAPFNSMEFDSDNEEKRTATTTAGGMLLETIDDDDVAPAPFNSMEFDSDNEGKSKEAAAARAMLLETIDDDDPAPAPFNSMVFEEHGADPSKPNAVQRTNTVNEDSILVPVREHIRDQSAQFRTGLASNRVPLFPVGRAGRDRNDGRNRDIDIHSRPRNAVESRTYPMDNNLHVAGEEKEEVSGPDIVLEADVEHDFTIHIPEATLVVERDEEEVYIATPVEPATPPEPSVPWWKRPKSLFGGMFLIVTAFSIAISQLMDKKDEPVAPVVATAPSMPPTTVISTSAPLASLATVIPTSAPLVSLASAWIWRQQGPAIVGDAAYDIFASVALSADAKTLVVGAPGTLYGETEKMGYVKVYRADKDGGDRVQLGETIFGDAVGDMFGWSVNISPDGNTLIIGSPGYLKMIDRPGYVRVFSLESGDNLGTGSWKQIGEDIVGEAIGDRFGCSVSLSMDGKTIAVGALNNNGNGDDSGHVRVYRLDDSGSSWTQLGEDIDGEAAYDNSGVSVSLSADGETVAIGAPRAGIYYHTSRVLTGHVRVYRIRIDSGGSSWEPLGQSMYGDNSDDHFGNSVNISPDGNTLAIGSPGYWNNEDRPGYVRVFSLESSEDLDTGSWKQMSQDIIGEGIGDIFGWSVSLSEDGKTIAVAAPFNDGNGDGSGHVRVYQIDGSGSSWLQLGEDIDGEAGYDNSGMSISLSADGKTVAIGSIFNDANGLDAGHVRVFVVE